MLVMVALHWIFISTGGYSQIISQYFLLFYLSKLPKESKNEHLYPTKAITKLYAVHFRNKCNSYFAEKVNYYISHDIRECVCGGGKMYAVTK